MSTATYIVLLFIFILFFANLPFISGRFFVLLSPAFVTEREKPFWACLVEWVVYFGFIVFLSRGIERKVTGVIHEQPWEFAYVIFFMFVVCSFPGFIYRYQIRKQLKRSKRKN